MRAANWTMILALVCATQVAHADTPLPSSAAVSPPKPLGHPGQWATDNDYPRDALRDLVAGDVKFELTVGVDGVPVSCTVAASSGSASLDGQTCTLLKQRARFSPALDAQGAPVIGQYTNTIHWALPDGPPTHVQAASFRVNYDVDVQGMVHNCALTLSTASASVNPCKSLVRVTPYRDAKGKAVARHIAVTTAIEVSDLP